MRFLSLILGVLLMGCASLTAAQSFIQTTTTTFAIAEHMLERGSVSVQALDPVLNASLEFKHYRPFFEQQLSLHGYSIEPDAKKAQYLAWVSYGVDSGRTEVMSTPVYGPMWDGALFPHPVRGVFSFGYGFPGVNVMGSTARQVTRYTRFISIDIVDARTASATEPRKIYEVRARSIGSCGSFIDVFEPILQGAFERWPGESGKAVASQVKWSGQCASAESR